MGERSTELCEHKMTDLFKRADEDGDGSLGKAEFMEVMGVSVVKHWLASSGLQEEDAGLVFDLLTSLSGKQEVTASELVNGAARLTGSARHIDLVALETCCKQNHNLLKQLSKQLVMVGMDEDESPPVMPHPSPSVSLEQSSLALPSRKIVKNAKTCMAWSSPPPPIQLQTNAHLAKCLTHDSNGPTRDADVDDVLQSFCRNNTIDHVS